MSYNFRLFWRMFYLSFFRSKHTTAKLSRKRLIFLILFYLIWPIGALFHWFFFFLDDILFPAHKTHPIEKPLFIIGNFRSGSTFLHRLLSRDDIFTSLTIWDIYLAPSVTQKKITRAIANIDNQLGGHLHRLLYAFDKATLGNVRIHPISFFKPEEDENILLQNWDGYFISYLFPFLHEMPNYTHFDEALSPQHKQRIMTFYRSMLQRHLYATGAKYFVAKNPAFSPKIETLIKFFPDARIINLVRNPLEMLPSTISWINYARRQFTDPGEGYFYLDEILDLTQHWYRHPLRFMDENPSPRYMTLKYDDLVTKPEWVIRGFYERFAYPDKPGLDAIIKQAVAETQAYRSDHVYAYEDMGFTRQQIIEIYADMFARFHFDHYEPIEPESVPVPRTMHATD